MGEDVVIVVVVDGGTRSKWKWLEVGDELLPALFLVVGANK